MRRKEREIKEMNEILSILTRCEVIRIACVDEGKPYLVPVNYGYHYLDNKLSIYFHSAKSGRKIDVLKKNPEVCFEADYKHVIVKGETACNWTSEYESIIGDGTAVFVEGEERILGMDSIMKHYGFEGKPEYNENAFNNMVIIRIDVKEITGKKNRKATGNEE